MKENFKDNFFSLKAKIKQILLNIIEQTREKSQTEIIYQTDVCLVLLHF